LRKPLGSGATAVVFLGKKIAGANEALDDKQYAVKVTIDRQTAEQERDNLLSLNRVQESGENFFPILYYPTSKEDSLEQSFYIGGVEKYLKVKAFVLIQEFVEGESVRDMLLHFSDTLTLPEPLALAIARQYVTMLERSHKAGITSWDRKLGDLRWSWADGDPSYDPKKILNRWRQDKLGSLKVLDWNVTHEVNDDNKAKDIFRLGLLWHRMLLGVEPKFRSDTATWQLLEPLESHAAWKTLSYGIQRLLKKMLHPDPDRRYKDTTHLAKDMDILIDGWREDAQMLWNDKIVSVYNGNTIQKEKGRDEIQNALALVSILRLRNQDYDDAIDNLPVDSALVSLDDALKVYNDFSLKNSISGSKWDDALGRINQLFAGVDDSVDGLLRRRYEFVLNMAKNSLWEKIDYAETLINYSNSIYQFDLSDATKRKEKLNEEILQEWENREAPKNSPDSWEQIRQAFVAAARYRLRIGEGSAAYTDARYEDVVEKLKEAVILRDQVRVISDDHLSLLDQVWENPEKTLKDAQKVLEEVGKRKSVLGKGIKDLSNETKESIEATIRRLQGFLRNVPYDVTAGQLLYLLENRRSYLETDDLAMKLILLKREEDVWKRFKEKAEGDDDITEEQLGQVKNLFAQKWVELRDEIVSLHLKWDEDKTAQPSTGEEKEQRDRANWPEDHGRRSGLLCRMYEDGAPENNKIGEIVHDYFNSLKEKLSKFSFVKDGGFAFDSVKADQARYIAAWGQAFALAWGDENLWEEDLSPKKIEERILKLRTEVHEKSFLYAIYQTAILSFDPEIWEETA